MKRSKSELEGIENFINRAYTKWGNSLKITTKDFNVGSLGYSFRFRTTDANSGREITVYNIVYSNLADSIKHTEYRIKMHEYGHIYFGHLDGLYEELDKRICNVFKIYRGELIDRINKNCGIDFGEKLIERVIDDPRLNHSLHNIAMDMEVNSKILSSEDIDEMEADLVRVFHPELDDIKNALNEEKEKADTEEKKSSVDDSLKQLEEMAKVKLILPQRYHFPDGTPFPDALTYSEYLLLIIQNLDQFVKMLISIKTGGNGDTEYIDPEKVSEFLDKLGGGDKAMGLDKLMESLGMTDKNIDRTKAGQGQDGDKDGAAQTDNKLGAHDTSNTGGFRGERDEKEKSYQGERNFQDNFQDHRTEERDATDVKRQLGQIKAGGGVGCGSSGAPIGQRTVNTDVDPVDEAIDEVIMNFKNRVIKRDTAKDTMKNWNMGINRKVISPSVSVKVTYKYEPKIVYLIDVSGSMDTCLVDRILNTIARKMRKCGTGRGLKYDIISWSTHLGEHIRDIDPKKGVPRISCGGGTRMAEGMKYFRENYGTDAVLVLISDFEDYLEEWHIEELKMPQYSMYGFNYGRHTFDQEFKYFKVKNFNNTERSW